MFLTSCILRVRLSLRVISPRAPLCSINIRTEEGASGPWWARSQWPQPSVRVWFSHCVIWTSPWWSPWRSSLSCGSGKNSLTRKATNSSWGCSRRPQYKASASWALCAHLSPLNLPSVRACRGHCLYCHCPMSVTEVEKAGWSPTCCFVTIVDYLISNCDKLSYFQNLDSSRCLGTFCCCFDIFVFATTK